MRCAGPGSWIKVVHLPVRTKLSVPCDPMSLASPCLPRYTSTVTPSERARESRLLVTTLRAAASREWRHHPRWCRGIWAKVFSHAPGTFAFARNVPEVLFTQLTFVRRRRLYYIVASNFAERYPRERLKSESILLECAFYFHRGDKGMIIILRKYLSFPQQ